MSCVTGFTGMTRTLFFTQDRRIDIPKEFVHELEESNNDSSKKRLVAVLVNLEDYMNTMTHEPGKFKDLVSYALISV